jgi:hypothetical protein
LRDSSRRTYGTGVKWFQEFCNVTNHHNLHDFTAYDWLTFIKFFAKFLRSRINKKTNKPLTGDYISCLISHVIEHVRLYSIAPEGTTFRCIHLTWMLAKYRSQDAAGGSIRTTCKISLSYALFLDACAVILLAHYTTLIKSCLRCALALGYGLSLRPGEYLFTGWDRPLIATCCTSHAYFIWDDVFYSICDYASAPQRVPDAFVVYIDSFKNDGSGRNGGPRAIGSDFTAKINLVEVIYDHCNAFPPPRNVPMLATHTEHLKSRTLNSVLKVVAQRQNLDPERLVPYSLRSGVLTQIEDASDETKMMQGYWTSAQGMKVYSRMSLTHAKSIAKRIHDETRYPISYSQNFYHG